MVAPLAVRVCIMITVTHYWRKGKIYNDSCSNRQEETATQKIQIGHLMRSLHVLCLTGSVFLKTLVWAIILTNLEKGNMTFVESPNSLLQHTERQLVIIWISFLCVCDLTICHVLCLLRRNCMDTYPTFLAVMWCAGICLSQGKL